MALMTSFKLIQSGFGFLTNSNSTTDSTKIGNITLSTLPSNVKLSADLLTAEVNGIRISISADASSGTAKSFSFGVKDKSSATLSASNGLNILFDQTSFDVTDNGKLSFNKEQLYKDTTLESISTLLSELNLQKLASIEGDTHHLLITTASGNIIDLTPNALSFKLNSTQSEINLYANEEVISFSAKDSSDQTNKYLFDSQGNFVKNGTVIKDLDGDNNLKTNPLLDIYTNLNGQGSITTEVPKVGNIALDTLPDNVTLQFDDLAKLLTLNVADNSNLVKVYGVNKSGSVNKIEMSQSNGFSGSLTSKDGFSFSYDKNSKFQLKNDGSLLLNDKVIYKNNNLKNISQSLEQFNLLQLEESSIKGDYNHVNLKGLDVAQFDALSTETSAVLAVAGGNLKLKISEDLVTLNLDNQYILIDNQGNVAQNSQILVDNDGDKNTSVNPLIQVYKQILNPNAEVTSLDLSKLPEGLTYDYQTKEVKLTNQNFYDSVNQRGTQLTLKPVENGTSLSAMTWNIVNQHDSVVNPITGTSEVAQGVNASLTSKDGLTFTFKNGTVFKIDNTGSFYINGKYVGKDIQLQDVASSLQKFNLASLGSSFGDENYLYLTGLGSSEIELNQDHSSFMLQTNSRVIYLDSQQDNVFFGYTPVTEADSPLSEYNKFLIIDNQGNLVSKLRGNDPVVLYDADGDNLNSTNPLFDVLSQRLNYNKPDLQRLDFNAIENGTISNTFYDSQLNEFRMQLNNSESELVVRADPIQNQLVNHVLLNIDDYTQVHLSRTDGLTLRLKDGTIHIDNKGKVYVNNGTTAVKTINEFKNIGLQLNAFNLYNLSSIEDTINQRILNVTTKGIEGNSGVHLQDGQLDLLLFGQLQISLTPDLIAFASLNGTVSASNMFEFSKSNLKASFGQMNQVMYLDQSGNVILDKIVSSTDSSLSGVDTTTVSKYVSTEVLADKDGTEDGTVSTGAIVELRSSYVQKNNTITNDGTSTTSTQEPIGNIDPTKLSENVEFLFNDDQRYLKFNVGNNSNVLLTSSSKMGTLSSLTFAIDNNQNISTLEIASGFKLNLGTKKLQLNNAGKLYLDSNLIATDKDLKALATILDKFNLKTLTSIQSGLNEVIVTAENGDTIDLTYDSVMLKSKTSNADITFYSNGEYTQITTKPSIGGSEKMYLIDSLGNVTKNDTVIIDADNDSTNENPLVTLYKDLTNSTGSSSSKIQVDVTVFDNLTMTEKQLKAVMSNNSALQLDTVGSVGSVGTLKYTDSAGATRLTVDATQMSIALGTKLIQIKNDGKVYLDGTVLTEDLDLEAISSLLTGLNIYQLTNKSITGDGNQFNIAGQNSSSLSLTPVSLTLNGKLGTAKLTDFYFNNNILRFTSDGKNTENYLFDTAGNAIRNGVVIKDADGDNNLKTNPLLTTYVEIYGEINDKTATKIGNIVLANLPENVKLTLDSSQKPLLDMTIAGITNVKVTGRDQSGSVDNLTYSIASGGITGSLTTTNGFTIQLDSNTSFTLDNNGVIKLNSLTYPLDSDLSNIYASLKDYNLLKLGAIDGDYNNVKVTGGNGSLSIFQNELIFNTVLSNGYKLKIDAYKDSSTGYIVFTLDKGINGQTYILADSNDNLIKNGNVLNGSTSNNPLLTVYDKLVNPSSSSNLGNLDIENLPEGFSYNATTQKVTYINNTGGASDAVKSKLEITPIMIGTSPSNSISAMDFYIPLSEATSNRKLMSLNSDGLAFTFSTGKQFKINNMGQVYLDNLLLATELPFESIASSLTDFNLKTLNSAVGDQNKLTLTGNDSTNSIIELSQDHLVLKVKTLYKNFYLNIDKNNAFMSTTTRSTNLPENSYDLKMIVDSNGNVIRGVELSSTKTTQFDILNTDNFATTDELISEFLQRYDSTPADTNIVFTKFSSNAVINNSLTYSSYTAGSTTNQWIIVAPKNTSAIIEMNATNSDNVVSSLVLKLNNTTQVSIDKASGINFKLNGVNVFSSTNLGVISAYDSPTKTLTSRGPVGDFTNLATTLNNLLDLDLISSVQDNYNLNQRIINFSNGTTITLSVNTNTNISRIDVAFSNGANLSMTDSEFKFNIVSPNYNIFKAQYWVEQGSYTQTTTVNGVTTEQVITTSNNIYDLRFNNNADFDNNLKELVTLPVLGFTQQSELEQDVQVIDQSNVNELLIGNNHNIHYDWLF